MTLRSFSDSRRPSLVAGVGMLWAIVFAGAGCNRPSAGPTEQPVPKVTTFAVVEQETIDFDEYTGQTEASAKVEVRSRLFGHLKDKFFNEGDMVEAEKPLFTIEPDEYDAIHQQSLARIELYAAELEYARARLVRRDALVKSGAVTKEEYEESVAAVKQAEAKIAVAKADANKTAVDLKYTVVRAPIAGRLDRAYETKGTLLTGGQASGTLLTTIVQEQPMYVYFDVDERALLRYMRMRKADVEKSPGSLREAEVDCYLKLSDEKTFKHAGKLDFVSNQVDRRTGTARIRGVFLNEDRSLASGLFVRVRIPVSKKYKALMIPEAALATDQSVKFVYVVESDGTAKRRAVTLGLQRGEMRIITAGLQAGEQVIVKGLQRVKPDQKVEAEHMKFEPPPELALPPPAPPLPTPVLPTPPPALPMPEAPATSTPAPAPVTAVPMPTRPAPILPAPSLTPAPAPAVPSPPSPLPAPSVQK